MTVVLLCILFLVIGLLLGALAMTVLFLLHPSWFFKAQVAEKAIVTGIGTLKSEVSEHVGEIKEAADKVGDAIRGEDKDKS